MNVLVVRHHLGEERAFGDTQHRGILGDVGLGKEQVAAEAAAQRAKQGGTSPELGRCMDSQQAPGGDPWLGSSAP